MSMSSATSTERTVWPLMSMPRIRSALACASSGLPRGFSPPAPALRLDDPPGLASRDELGRDLAGLLRSGGHLALLDRNAMVSEELLSLVLKQVHSGPSSCAALPPMAAGPHSLWPVPSRQPSDVSGRSPLRVRLAERRADPVHNLGRGRSRRENPGHAHPAKFRDVLTRDDSAAEHDDVGGVTFLQQFEYPGKLGHVRAGQHREPDCVGV